MSDRFYTTIDVSGPNAAAAEETIKNILSGWGGGWWEERDCFFDHNSGQAAVFTVAQVSRQFPTETFRLFVNGGMAEGKQGPVKISNGQVADGRSGFCSYGDAQEPLCENCHPQEFQPTDLLAIDRTVAAGQVTCPQCHAIYEYTIRDGELVGWDELYEIPASESKAFPLTLEQVNRFAAITKSLMKLWEELPSDDSDRYSYRGGLDGLEVKGELTGEWFILGWEQVLTDIRAGRQSSIKKMREERRLEEATIAEQGDISMEDVLGRGATQK